jgi:hypothetical protein
MNAKQRDAVSSHWRSVIQREARDPASLEQIGARAMHDSDVRDDPTLQSLIRSDLERRRAELEREQQSQTAPTAPRATRPEVRFVSSISIPVPRQEPVWTAFEGLARAFSGVLEHHDEGEALVLWGQMRALQAENPGVIPASALQPYGQQLGRLRTLLERLRDQIAALTQQVVAASRQGDEQAVGKLMRRLSAICVTHPRLLDEARLEEIRADIVRANEEREDGLTARKLVDRERAVLADITRIAAAVHEFHRVVWTAPETSEEFRGAELAYLRALQDAPIHDPEWLAGFVLELADVLAEWSVPPPAVEQQVDRFLENVRLGLKRIHAEVGQIATRPNETEAS